MSEEKERQLFETRKERGLFKIKELAKMFDIGRSSIDYACNTGQLKFMSPNNKTRYILLNDFIEYSQKKDNTPPSTKQNALSNLDAI